jgi:hypothetical protein
MSGTLSAAGVRLPRGAKLIEATSFYTTTRLPNDTFTERIVMVLNGHNVQVMRYDHSDTGVIVYVDGRPGMMHMDCVSDYIVRYAR